MLSVGGCCANVDCGNRNGAANRPASSDGMIKRCAFTIGISSTNELLRLRRIMENRGLDAENLSRVWLVERISGDASSRELQKLPREFRPCAFVFVLEED